MKYHFNQKKSAMFGLDARISLAIFGALSVITGAALFKAIEQAKLTALHEEINNFGKSVEQFFLDTGHVYYGFGHLLITDAPSFFATPAPLGWKGPYFKGKYDTLNIEGEIFFASVPNSNLIKEIQYYDPNLPFKKFFASLPNSEKSFIMILVGFMDESIAKSFDAKFDDGNKDSGEITWTCAVTDDCYIEVKLMPIPANAGISGEGD